MKSYQLSSLIASRYLKAKKSVQAINTISYISIVAVTVLAASMIVLLSVFNGFETLLKDLYKAFYPDVKITAQKGKWIHPDEEMLRKIRSVDGVAAVSQCAEDMVLIFRETSQKVALLKGVDEQWFHVTGFDSFIVEGRANFENLPAEINPAILGISIANEFGVNIKSPMSDLDIYYPREDVQTVNLEQSLNSLTLSGQGIFSAQEEFDGRYILTPLGTAQQLFDNNELLTSLEIKLKDKNLEKKVIAELKKLVGKDMKVLSQYEQNKTIYMVMRSEKLAIYIILTFIMIIASFTLIGVLSMIAIDKKKDMSVMKAMGAKDSLVFKIFMMKGVYLSLLGGLIGITLGTLICLGQQYFGWIQLEQGFIIDEYPVDIQITDIFIVLFIVVAVGSAAAYFPARKAKKETISFREE